MASDEETAEMSFAEGFVSPDITQQLLKGSKATTQAAFGIKKARLLKIKLCSMIDQEKLIRQINYKMSACDDAEQTVNRTLQQSEAMRQSILKQVFEGEL